jgi:hypothetical protein
MFEIYKINEGEDINSIANNYMVSPDYLFKLNGFNCDREVRAGDNIIVPKLTNDYIDYFTIKEGSNLYDFAKKNNIDYNLLSNLNGLNTYDYLYPNQVVLIPKRDTSFYITKDNDTLNSVCKLMKANLNNLLKENNKIYLKEGQLIVYKEK